MITAFYKEIDIKCTNIFTFWEFLANYIFTFNSKLVDYVYMVNPSNSNDRVSLYNGIKVL